MPALGIIMRGNVTIKMNLECIPCFQKQALNAVRMATDDPQLRSDILREVIDKLMSMEWDQSPPKLAQAVHKIVRDRLGKDPYQDVKRESNELALSLYDHMKDVVSNSDDELNTAVRIAIAGNIMDFGPYSHFDFDSTLSECLVADMAVDQCSSFKEQCEDAMSLLYLVDNAGEVVCDKVLLETMMGLYPLKKVTMAVKGGNILNDATYHDIDEVGLNKLPNIDFLCVSNGESFTGIPRESDSFRKIMDSYDMVISKGQGNYEMLSSNKDIFFLLKAKCALIAEDIGVPMGSMVCGRMI